MKNFLSKVIDKSIFKKNVKIRVPVKGACFTCKGEGIVSIVGSEQKIICPACRGDKYFITGETKVVEGNVLYVPVAFEENKERVLYVSICYYENDIPVNITVSSEDILDED
jgi:hypothetical protein